MSPAHANVRSRAVRPLRRLCLAICLAAAFGTLAACGGDPPPTCTGCGPTTNPTPFTPGELPGSVESLSGDRCGAAGSQLFVFNNVLLAAPLADTSTNRMTFAVGEPFLIYWSVCNVGADAATVPATPQGLQVTGPGFGQTFPYTISALGSCICEVPIPQVQFASGLPTAGSYTATLVGAFNTSVAIVVTP